MSVWRDLSGKELSSLGRLKRDRLLEPGEILYHKGDPCEGIYCIREGLVGERRLDANGNSILVRLSHPGTTIGYQELLTKTDFRNSAEVLLKRHVCFISRSVVSDLLANNPSLGERFLSRSMEDFKQLEDSFVETKMTNVRSRFLHILMVLYERFGHFDESLGDVLEIQIARQDLAALVGTTPETISRTIGKLQENKLVQFNGRHAHFPSLNAVFDEISAPT
jgi:CRP/FNR family transcriptional regulator